ncbi:MAG: Gfo/Idh/MocA family oxidoreductase [Bacteroidia bacterium]
MRRVALLGVGRWGEKLLRLLEAKGALAKVWTRTPANYPTLRASYAHIPWTADLEEIWNDPSLTAVCIATPAPTHPQFIRQALEAGKDVFCEKPLAFSASELKALIALAEKRSLILMGGHVLHYHPAVLLIQSWIKAGKLGRILGIWSERASFGRFPLQEDALWGLAIHDLGLFYFLLESEPVSSEIRAERHWGQAWESVRIALRFSWGAEGHIFASWIAPERRRRLSVMGSEGVLTFSEEGEKPTLVYYPIRTTWRNGHAARPALEGGEVLALPATEPLAAEIEDFLQALETRQPPRTEAKALLPAVALAEHLARQLAPTPVNYFVHPTALVDEEVEIGEGTKIWHFSHILRGSRIGKNCILGQNVVVGPYVRIGDNCKIQNNVSLYYGVELEDGVLCGPSCVFTNDKYPRAFIERRNEFLPTRVRQGATIGANATIMCGVTIGRFAMVGAGAVVVHDVPDFALVLGNPARLAGWVCRCGETLQECEADTLYYCSRCDLYYRRTLKGLEEVSLQKG